MEAIRVRLRMGAVLFGIILAALWMIPTAPNASASVLLANCGTRWQFDGTDGLNWCVNLAYNDTTGDIKGTFDFSDYATGNVYAIRVVDVTMYRNVDGEVSVKDSCDYCPDDEFVYDAVQQVSTDWSGYLCNRWYRVTATFRIQWGPNSDLGGPITRGTDWALLC
jgi:hypothetical protein